MGKNKKRHSSTYSRGELRAAARFKSSFLGRRPTNDERRGYDSERCFEIMVKELQKRGRLPWLQGFTKASVTDDTLNKTHYRMRVVNWTQRNLVEFSIPIQIKSSFGGAQRFLHENRNDRIRVIVMHYRMNIYLLKKLLQDIYTQEVKKHRAEIAALS